MKKLYERIEDINIVGDIDQLSELVRAMDLVLQNIAEGTGQLVGILIRYSTSNSGKQYKAVVETAVCLWDDLSEASMELNDLQKQVVEYQNKIYRYEGMAESASIPNAYMVSKQRVDVDNTSVTFNRADMLDLVANFKNYSDFIHHYMSVMNEKKNDIAVVWRDTQYYDFAEFIEEVIRGVLEAKEIFDEYVHVLEEKIKELE